MAAVAPERPAGVPEGGFWNPEVGNWEVSQLSAQGTREGECLFYRRDGSLQSRCRFVAGVQEGPFAIFHPDGRVAREGSFTAGRFEGIVSAYVSEGAGAEPLRSCCVPAGAVRLDVRYEDGNFVQEIFYDGAGRPILSDGRPWPPRPSSVSDDAEYDEAGGRWARRRPALHRFWTEAGLLTSEVEFSNGFRRAERSFDAAGEIEEECEFSQDGRRHGSFRRRLPVGAESPYAEAAIREERGTFDRGQAVGSWTFLDGDGAVLRTAARGLPFVDGAEAASPAFAPGSGGKLTAGDWWALARTLPAEGRVREGLCAAARAAARDGDRAALERALAADVVALAPALAAQRGDALAQSTDLTVASILDALMTGADAASAFRALAAVLPGAQTAALDLVAASLLLAPERSRTHLTRAFIRFQHGDERGARFDAEIVASESPDAAASFVSYLESALRPFTFWPAREPLAPDPSLAEIGAGLVRDLDEVRATIAVYATRLRRVRAAVQALIGPDATPSWLPPDLSALLPGGPVPLRRTRVSVDAGVEDGNDDAGEGPQTIEVEIDEEIPTAGLAVPALLGAAQADWGALSWLCWSVGLDRVALPTALAEPPLFAEAMKTIVTRCWRAQDRLNTGGLLARSNGVPGFAWEGIDIDALPQHSAQMVAEEYLRARSAFFWLASPEVASPFQTDLKND